MRKCKKIFFAFIAILAIACGATAHGRNVPSESPAISATMPSPSEWAPMPIEQVKGLVTFQAIINGRPATVLLDNGASWTAIDESFARRMGLSLEKSTQVFRTGRSTLPTWQTNDVTFVMPKALTLKGRFKAVNLQAVSKAMGHSIDAVLGGDVLHKVALMIDIQASTMGVFPTGVISPKGNKVAVVAISQDAKIDAKINGNDVRLAVDLGSSGVVSLSDMAWNRIFRKPHYYENSGRSIKADGVSVDVHSTKASLHMGALQSPDAPIYSGFVPVDATDGIVGTGLLLKGVLVFDPQAGRILMFRPSRYEAHPPNVKVEC